VNGGNTPDIELSGSREMIDFTFYFTFYGPRQRPGEGREAFIVWRLIPARNSDLGDLDDIGSIMYRTVPKGYKQVYPENNSPSTVKRRRILYAPGYNK